MNHFISGSNAYGQCGRPIIEEENYFLNQVVHKVKGPWIDLDEKVEDIYCGQDHRLIDLITIIFLCNINFIFTKLFI